MIGAGLPAGSTDPAGGPLLAVRVWCRDPGLRECLPADATVNPDPRNYADLDQGATTVSSHYLPGATLHPPLAARGLTLRVLGIARISTDHQDALSLDDQEALVRCWLERNAPGPFDLQMIKGRGSGELLDRKELLDAMDAVETGRYDLVLTEDLGRIVRRAQAITFLELCEDHDTRVVALNDTLDTAQPDWRLKAGFAAMRHEMYNADTSQRIRRSLRGRFERGGVVQTLIYGYVKPRPGCSDAEVQKDPAAEPIITEVVRLLEGGASYSEVADWLNAEGVKPGPGSQGKKWTCALVTGWIHNPLLKGVRVRNKKVTRRVNKSGSHRSVHAPPEMRLERSCPHLAFIEPARYDRLIATLDARNAKYRRKGTGGVDTRKGVPKKRTTWPGQHLTCGVCGRTMRYGGHGEKDHLLCAGATDYKCWMAYTADGPLAAKKITDAVFGALADWPEFDPALVASVTAQLQQRQGRVDERRQELERRRDKVLRGRDNIVAAIRAVGISGTLADELRRIEAELTEVAGALEDLEHEQGQPVRLPALAELKALACKRLQDLAATSQEFGRVMRVLLERVEVRPYQCLTGGKVVLRAHATLSLVSLLDAGPEGEALGPVLRRELIVDLFEPPQHAAHRQAIEALTAQKVKQRDIAARLGTHLPVVQRSLALSRAMAAQGVSDPYLPLTAPPEEGGRLKRHLRAKYDFTPLHADPAKPDGNT